jgi:hypothetical protein
MAEPATRELVSEGMKLFCRIENGQLEVVRSRPTGRIRFPERRLPPEGAPSTLRYRLEINGQTEFADAMPDPGKRTAEAPVLSRSGQLSDLRQVPAEPRPVRFRIIVPDLDGATLVVSAPSLVRPFEIPVEKLR